ncbi:MAG: hypothetical protein CL833_14860 [Crocinitomicaceae bacterium]|nr:hypothetical protein [Crocinitomicaceae bacterium]
MKKFIFLIDTSPVPKKQRIVVHLVAGFVFVLGALICLFSFSSLFPELTQEIGFHSNGTSTFLAVLITGLVFCSLAYLMAFAMTLSWKREAKGQQKYNRIFGTDASFEIADNFPDEWVEPIRNTWKSPGIINLISLKGAYSKNLCFADVRYAGPLNRGADYSLVLIVDQRFQFSEKMYFRSSKKAMDYLEVHRSTAALQLIQKLHTDVSVLLDNHSITLKKLHKFNESELQSVYRTVRTLFN